MLAVEKTKLALPIERPEDVGRLLGAIRAVGDEVSRPELHTLFATLTYTGRRRGEALGLRWVDVDLDRHMLTVRHSYDGPTKSGKQRIVPVPGALAAILRAYRLADPWKGELCFSNERVEMFSPNAKLETLFRRALDRAQLPRIRVHDLRHLFASHFVMGGGDIFTLQRILGHSTPQLTSDTYAHLSPRHLAGEAERFCYPAPSEPQNVIRFRSRSRAAELGPSGQPDDGTSNELTAAGPTS